MFLVNKSLLFEKEFAPFSVLVDAAANGSQPGVDTAQKRENEGKNVSIQLAALLRWTSTC